MRRIPVGLYVTHHDDDGGGLSLFTDEGERVCIAWAHPGGVTLAPPDALDYIGIDPADTTQAIQEAYAVEYSELWEGRRYECGWDVDSSESEDARRDTCQRRLARAERNLVDMRRLSTRDTATLRADLGARLASVDGGTLRGDA